MEAASLERFHVAARRRNATTVDGRDVRGMMVMNQHYLGEPSKRAPLYGTTRDVDWPQQAADTGITLVSTWELFELLRAVAAGAVERQQARRFLEQAGHVLLHR